MRNDNLEKLEEIIDDMAVKREKLNAYAFFSPEAKEARKELESWIDDLLFIYNSENVEDEDFN